MSTPGPLHVSELSDHHLAALSGHMSDILYLGELKLAIRNTQYAVRVKALVGPVCKTQNAMWVMKMGCGLRDTVRNTQYVIRNTE